MTYIMNLLVGNNWGDTHLVSGRGDTPEQAKADCLRQVARELTAMIELAPGVNLPPAEYAKMPKSVPTDRGLLIMVTYDHSGGDAYKWRYFALPEGEQRIGIKSHGVHVHHVGPIPVIHGFTDSNSEYSFPLPEGSFEWQEGAWVPTCAAEYTY